MTLPPQLRNEVETKLEAYAERKIPPEMREKIRLSWELQGNTVTLYEERPVTNSPDAWGKLAVARFRSNPERTGWTLYCAGAEGKWHEYEDAGPAGSIDALIEEVDADPTRIFWG